MADEINLQFLHEGGAPALMSQWRAAAPDPIRAAGFALADEAVDTLTYELRHRDAVARLMNLVSLGLNRLWGGRAETVFRLSVRFDADGGHRSRVTILGRAPEDARAALGRYAAQHGTVLRTGGVPATGP